jgi:hypothetical protein
LKILATTAVNITTPMNHVPVTTAEQSSLAAQVGAVFKATDLFHFSDADGNSTLYAAAATESDPTVGGSWYLNGSKVSGTVYVGIQNIGLLEYHATSAGTETISLQVSDGHAWSDPGSTEVTIVDPAHTIAPHLLLV